MPDRSKRRTRTRKKGKRGKPKGKEQPVESTIPALNGDFVDNDGLTEQQRRFVVEYIATRGNGAEAARRAYPNQTDDSARNQASENLTKPYIRAAIHRILKPELVAARTTRQVVLREIGDGMAFDPIECTNADGSLRLLRDIPWQVRRFLRKYKQSDIRMDPKGPVVGVATEIEWDHVAYIKMGAQYNKLLTTRVELDDKTGMADRLARARQRQQQRRA